MNKIAKTVFVRGFASLALCACGDGSISIDESVALASDIYNGRKEMKESEFSASYLELKDQQFTSIDVRFKEGKYAYFSGRTWSQKNPSDPANILKDDYFLFSEVVEETNSAGSIVSLEERYVFAVDSKIGSKKSSLYNVISEQKFNEILALMEEENRAQFKVMEDKAYDYLAHYDGYTSPVSFATDEVHYAPKGNAGDLILEANQTKTYKSHFVSSHFGSIIDEMRDATDVYSEMHRFKNGRPYQIQDSLDHNKVNTASYSAAYSYGNAYRASYNANTFKQSQEELHFAPKLGIVAK